MRTFPNVYTLAAQKHTHTAASQPTQNPIQPETIPRCSPPRPPQCKHSAPQVQLRRATGHGCRHMLLLITLAIRLRCIPCHMRSARRARRLGRSAMALPPPVFSLHPESHPATNRATERATERHQVSASGSVCLRKNLSGRMISIAG